MPQTTQNPEQTLPLLRVNNIEVVYEHIILVLKGVSLTVAKGAIVALLGANGAGKSTTLKAISSLLRAERGAIVKGSIEFCGQRIDGLDPSAVVRMGIIQVMEGRRCFEHLSIEENLLCGAHTRADGHSAIHDSLELVYTYLPRLRAKRHSQAGYTSGGEQQMTALGRALMAKPTMILLDEPSMGLAPDLVAEIFEIIQTLNRREGVTFLLAEQNTHMALRHSSFGYVIETGRMVMEGEAQTLLANEDIKEFYLGLGERGRKNYRDAKHYRRRKRWLMQSV